MTDRPAPQPAADLEPLNMIAPPWWDAWQKWQASRDPRPDNWLEGDPRDLLVDDLSHELAIMAYAAGWEQLLTELVGLHPGALDVKVERLANELREYREKTRGR